MEAILNTLQNDKLRTIKEDTIQWKSIQTENTRLK